jgi:hypothetical protein
LPKFGFLVWKNPSGNPMVQPIFRKVKGACILSNSFCTRSQSYDFWIYNYLLHTTALSFFKIIIK